ncbi:MAG: hypothetical protein ACHQ15_02475 [Candidatus Limnocylindrales bacterium]
MIRKATLHLIGDQPLFVDMESLPLATDVVLVCTNVTTTGGQRPSFIDASDSVFVFPFAQVRFLEVPVEALGTRLSVGQEPVPAPPQREPDMDLDEDFLRRVREA